MIFCCQIIMTSTLIILSGCATFETRQAILSRINRQVAQERVTVQSSLDATQAESKAIWAQGDIAFFSLWQDGIEQEEKGQYDIALTLYRKALDTPRYEMESYHVLLPIGRVLFLSGKTTEAKIQLQEFIKIREGELNGEVNIMWELSDEGRKSLKKNLAFAKWLLQHKL